MNARPHPAACSGKGSSDASTGTPICPPQGPTELLSRRCAGRKYRTMKSLHALSTERPTGQIVPQHRPFVTVGEALGSALRQMQNPHPLTPIAGDLEAKG